MSVYRFGKDSLISEITIQRSEGGGLRAYAYAKEGASPKALSEMRHILTANDMQWSPIFAGGKPALEIRGFGKNESGLLRTLGSHDFVVGSYHKEPSVGDVMSWRDKFRKNTLQASGAFYFVGDAGFLAYGYREAFENKKLVNLPILLAGVFYAVGTPIIAFFGRGDKSDFQLKDIAHNTLQELKKQGFKAPKGSAIRAVANGHNEGFGRKIYNFCERFPAEITNSFFGLAGVMMIWAGIKDIIARKKGTSSRNKTIIGIDIGIGVMTALAGVISVFVEEQAPDPNAPKKKGLAGVWQYIGQKPLMAAGGILGISTLGHAASTMIGWKGAKVILADKARHTAKAVEEAENMKKALPGRGVFTVTNLTAEALMAVSSKGHGAGVKTDTSLDRSVYAVMADLVHRTPESNRDALLGEISTYLAGKKHLGGHPADIENGIREQLAALDKNPWTNHKHPAQIAEAKSERKSDWRQKTLLQAAASPAVSAAMI